MAFQQTASKLASNDDNLVKKLSPETAERISMWEKVYVMNVHYFGRGKLPTEAKRRNEDESSS